MPMSPSHAMYCARQLSEYARVTDRLIPTYASSNIEVYPYQIVAAMFALRSPYLKRHGRLMRAACHVFSSSDHRNNPRRHLALGIVIYVIEQGVNYFYTAYMDPNSEDRLSKVLAKGYRDKVFIATKTATFLVKKHEDFDRMLDTHLKRLQTDHIDYYFMHMLSTVSEWNRVCKMGILDWINKRKKAGQLKM